MLRTWGLCCGVLLAILLATGSAQAAHNVSILYTNDTHGHLQSFFADGNKPVGGVAKRAIYFKEKRRHPNMTWLTLDAGDAISGTPLSDIFNGFLDVEAMNRLGYDAMTLGVHDFDYGIDILRKRMTEAKFPMLSANIVIEKTGQTFAKPYTIITRNGMRFAILGLTTMDIADQVAEGNFRNLAVVDPIQKARELVPQLRAQSDMVIALTHLGVNEDIHLASQVQGIDVIVGGYSHSELQVPMKVGETLIVQDSYWGKQVGLLKLSYARDTSGALRRVYFDNMLETLDGRFTENTDYLTWLGTYKAQMVERMGTLLGTTHGRFNASKVKSSETEMGNFVTDVLREKTGADIAILPAAFFRAGLPDGAVTLGDLFEALPFDHYAVTLTVTGNELHQILNDAADQIGKPGFPQVSGASFSIFNGRAPMSTIKVGGAELDQFGTYTVTTSDFIADGGLGYAAMGTVKTRSYTGRLIRDIVRERLANGQTATSRLYGRITFLAQEPETLMPEVDEEPELASSTTPDTAADEGFVPDHESEDDEFATTPPEETASDDSLSEGEPEIIDEPVTSEPPGGARPAEPLVEDDGFIEDDNVTEEHVIDEAVDEAIDEPVVDEPIAEDEEAATSAPTDDTVSLEDEVVSDEESETPAADEEPAPPAKPVSSGALPTEDMLKDAKTLGSTTHSENGIDYTFELVKTKKGTYLFRLIAKNATGQPLEVQYPSGKRSEFAVFRGNDMLWNFNHNRFFSQSIITDTIPAGPGTKGERRFLGEWSGLTIDRTNVKRGETYRFEATHFLLDGPVVLSFEAALQ